jgi:hypothetical protein
MVIRAEPLLLASFRKKKTAKNMNKVEIINHTKSALNPPSRTDESKRSTSPGFVAVPSNQGHHERATRIKFAAITPRIMAPKRLEETIPSRPEDLAASMESF